MCYDSKILTSALLYLAGRLDPQILPGIIPGSIAKVIRNNISVIKSNAIIIIERISVVVIY